jgi:hypothetical protein
MARTPTPKPDASGIVIRIPAPRMRVMQVDVVGTAPLMVHCFSSDQRLVMRVKHEQGSQAKKGKTREPRDFNANFEGARHRFADGGDGFAASAIRNAAISACRLVNFKMTIAKLSIFAVEDGEDVIDATPLIRIIGPAPEVSELMVRNATGVADIRVRPMWRRWGATLKIRFDLDQFSNDDVMNLLHRIGQQVGVCEGRPDSKDSAVWSSLAPPCRTNYLASDFQFPFCSGS